MSDCEEFHDSHVGDDSEGEEVVVKATSSTSPTAPPEIITKSDLQEVIEGWKIKFQKLTEGVRAIQRYRYSTAQCPRNFDLGIYNLKPLRATNAGPWERELYDW